jgi:hypothetical protein
MTDSQSRPPAPDGNDQSRRADASRHARRPRGTLPVQIDRIETVTMTPEEYDEAVHALAVLVCNYWRAHPEILREDRLR